MHVHATAASCEEGFGIVIGKDVPLSKTTFRRRCFRGIESALSIPLLSIDPKAANEAMRLVPVKELTLEEALEFIAGDELIKVTPNAIRLRKRVLQANHRPKSSVCA